MDQCFENKIQPEEKGNCDCCFSENVKINVCPSNNKCEYSMCSNCIKNLEKKTKTNQCPACREQIIIIKNINLHEPETVDNVRIVWGIPSCWCCICYLDDVEANRSCLHLRASLFCLRHNCCCIYDYFKFRYENENAAAFYVLCIHTLMILFGRVIYSVLENEKLSEFWCLWYVFLGKAFIGLSVSILSAVITILSLMFLYTCCCKEPGERD
jgi:hypothetical protein